MARGRAWGNALGGWRLQGRGPMGRFLRKGAGSYKSNYRPSRNQLAADRRAREAKIARRRATAKKVAKNTAIVGGAALAVGATAYGVKRVNSSQAEVFAARQGAKYVRNMAKYSAGAGAAKSSTLAAGSFAHQVRMSPRAPIGLKGFSNASTVSHNVSRLLPPVSYHTNTRRPARYRYHGDALKKTLQVDMEGKGLIPKIDMIKEKRSFAAKKGSWKRKANKNLADRSRKAAEKATEAKQTKPVEPPPKAKAAAVQNPAPAKPKSAPKAAPKAKAAPKSKSAPKSKNVVAPKPAVTVAETAPSKPATGAGSKKAKSSPAKQAATGGGKKTPKAVADAMPQDFYETNYAPKEDSADVKISGGKVRSVDQYGEEVIIPIAGRRGNKPVGRGPNQRPKAAPPRPKAANQPRPQETVQREATKSAGNEDNIGAKQTIIINPMRMVKPKGVDHSAAWYAKAFDIEYLEELLKESPDATATQIAAAAATYGVEKQQAQLLGKAVRDMRKAKRRSKSNRNPVSGAKMGKDETRASQLAGDVVVTTQSKSARIAKLNDRMASGKQAPMNPREVQDAKALLKPLGISEYSADLMWKESFDRDTYNVAERKAMKTLSNWLNLIEANKKK